MAGRRARRILGVCPRSSRTGAAPGANGSFEADVRSSAIMVPHPNTMVEELLASAARGPGRDLVVALFLSGRG